MGNDGNLLPGAGRVDGDQVVSGLADVSHDLSEVFLPLLFRVVEILPKLSRRPKFHTLMIVILIAYNYKRIMEIGLLLCRAKRRTSPAIAFPGPIAMTVLTPKM